MTTFNRILVPLDGSKRAESALSWVQILPARHLRLIRVCPEANDARAEAATYLEEVASQMAPSGATIDIQVIDDGPAEGIVSAAADADLVVMCTHGAGDGGRLLFGSVADRVARHAPVPTMLVRGGREPIAAALVRRIVVPLDGSPAAERALPMATTLASILAAQLHLVTVVQSQDDDSAREHAGVMGHSTALAYIEQKAGEMSTSDVIATTEGRCGEAADELLAAVGPGDLLVITTHGQGAARRWQMGRVAEKLLGHASAPLVLIRADSP